MAEVSAHDQKITHNYLMHFPSHEPRPGDPHYVDFEHYRHTYIDTARCKLSDLLAHVPLVDSGLVGVLLVSARALLDSLKTI